MGLTDIITFEGASVSELEEDFRSAVDEYLKTCKEIGREPEKPFSGRFMLRVPPNCIVPSHWLPKKNAKA